jgi:hemolysin activation/secretion protein
MKFLKKKNIADYTEGSISDMRTANQSSRQTAAATIHSRFPNQCTVSKVINKKRVLKILVDA